MNKEFSPNYIEWRRKFKTEPKYTREQMATALRRQKEEYAINRVIQSYTGRVGPNESRAMRILAIHKTPEGILVIVQ